ncbi:MAG: type II toxin-antitoxin system RelE/ParE family toxin [Candidatus Poribacteria bacterium]|nr:type II toxin-antitoxin system RelE/ParE family toxin [Candidatus Poribacteria bacterium]
MKETEQEHEIKPLVWVGSSHEDLTEFPPEVQDEMGYALYVAQEGDKHPKAKPLKGFSGVMEIRSNYRTNTYRVVYTTKISDAIYVLHAFEKKAKRGIQTPKKEIALIKRRLKIAQDLSEGK